MEPLLHQLWKERYVLRLPSLVSHALLVISLSTAIEKLFFLDLSIYEEPIANLRDDQECARGYNCMQRQYIHFIAIIERSQAERYNITACANKDF